VDKYWSNPLLAHRMQWSTTLWYSRSEGSLLVGIMLNDPTSYNIPGVLSGSEPDRGHTKTDKWPFSHTWEKFSVFQSNTIWHRHRCSIVGSHDKNLTLTGWIEPHIAVTMHHSECANSIGCSRNKFRRERQGFKGHLSVSVWKMKDVISQRRRVLSQFWVVHRVWVCTGSVQSE